MNMTTLQTTLHTKVSATAKENRLQPRQVFISLNLKNTSQQAIIMDVAVEIYYNRLYKKKTALEKGLCQSLVTSPTLIFCSTCFRNTSFRRVLRYPLMVYISNLMPAMLRTSQRQCCRRGFTFM